MNQASAIKKWQLVRDHLREQMPVQLFETFIKPLEARCGPQGEFELISPGDLRTLSYLKDRYLVLIENSLQITSGMQGPVRLCSRHTQSNRDLSGIPGSPELKRLPPRPQGSLDNRPTQAYQSDYLASGHLMKSLEWLGQGLGPAQIILVGPEGSGKTHLARQWVQAEKQLGHTACVLSLETFLTEFSIACRKKDTISWRENLRKHDLIVLDDFHYFKPTAVRAAEEMRYLLDERLESNRRIVLTSLLPLKDLQMPPELLSRVLSLMELRLEYPDQTDREKLLQIQLQAARLEMTQAQISYIARRIDRDVRRLKSVPQRLGPWQIQPERLLNTEMPELDRLLGDLYPVRPNLDPQKVLAHVARYFQIPVQEIKGSDRSRKPSLARHLFAYLCTEELGLSQKETATLIGRRDHGSVIHARRKITEMLEADLFFASQIADIRRDLYK